MILVDQSKEAFVHSLSNHFAPWDEFSIELVENVLKVVSLNGLL